MSHVPLPGPAAACACVAASPPARTGEPEGAGGRFGPTHALILLIAFLGLGCTLFLAGTELSTVLALLGGCGAIGAEQGDGHGDAQPQACAGALVAEPFLLAAEREDLQAGAAVDGHRLEGGDPEQGRQLGGLFVDLGEQRLGGRLAVLLQQSSGSSQDLDGLGLGFVHGPFLGLAEDAQRAFQPQHVLLGCEAGGQVGGGLGTPQLLLRAFQPACEDVDGGLGLFQGLLGCRFGGRARFQPLLCLGGDLLGVFVVSGHLARAHRAGVGVPLLLAACVVDLLVAAGAAGRVQAVEEQAGGGAFGDVVEELGGLLAFGACLAEDTYGLVPGVLRVGECPGGPDRVVGEVGQGSVRAVSGQQACQCVAGLGEFGFQACAFGCAFGCFGGRDCAACLVLGEAHVVHGLDAGEGGGRGQVQEDLQQAARQSVGGDLAQQCLVAAGREVDRPEVGGPPVGLGAGLLEGVDQGLQIHPPQHQAGYLFRVAVVAGGPQQGGDAPVRGGGAYAGQCGRVGAGQDDGRGDLPVGPAICSA
ncbi:hypothetical protein OG416_35680 (plasmid) [Streptomyces longwoodensis]|nr:hypothetical protein OG416_35680 [Streptomyces longwoodensis]